MTNIGKMALFRSPAAIAKRLFRESARAVFLALLAPILTILALSCRPRRQTNISKVLIIPEFDKYGGTRTYLRTLLGFAQEQGWKTGVAIEHMRIDASVVQMCDAFNAELLPISDLPQWVAKRRRSRFFNIIYEAWTTIELSRVFKPDCIVASVGTPGDCLGIFLLPRPILYILHTSPTQALDPARSLIIRFGLGKRKELLTVSSYSRGQILHRWGLRGSKGKYVMYVHNATSPATIIENATDMSANDVITIGHLVDYKNPKQWIRIAQAVIGELPNAGVRFIWLGNGPLYEECVDSLSEADKDRILFPGYCSEPRMYLRAARLYFQPSLVESHGLAVIEAMSMGIPSIVSRVGGLPESIIDGRNGYLIDLDKEQDIINKIILLLRDDDLRAKMAMQCSEIFCERFSIARWTEKMEAIFDHLF